MQINNLNAEDLGQFTGSEQWYRHSLVRSITYTDGAKYVADHGGAYWLLDEIALAQKFSAAVKAEPFQVWKLTVNDRRGLLTCDDGNDNVVYTKPIPFTDIPLTEIKFYFTDNVDSFAGASTDRAASETTTPRAQGNCPFRKVSGKRYEPKNPHYDTGQSI